MSKQANSENWTELINDFQASGQSMAAWCRNNNLKVHQLTYRLRKAKEASAAKPTNWLPVDLGTETALTIKVGPYEIIVSDNFDPVLLKKYWLPLSAYD